MADHAKGCRVSYINNPEPDDAGVCWPVGLLITIAIVSALAAAAIWS